MFIISSAGTLSGSGLGLVACAVAALVDYHFWQRTWWIWFALSLVGLALCFLPPFRHKINGSWRWLEFHGFTCQPSEFAKMAAVFFLAFWFSRYETESNQTLARISFFPWRSLVCLSRSSLRRSISARPIADRRDHFRCYVHRRDESRPPRHPFIRRNRRDSLPRDPHCGTQWPAHGLPPSRSNTS